MVNKGNASLSGTTSITIVGAPGLTTLAPGQYNLIGLTSGTGLSTGGTFVLTNNTIQVGSTTLGLSLSNSNNLEVLNVGAAPPNIAYWAGAINGVWSTNNSGVTNWRTDATTNTDTQLPPGSTTNVFFSTTNPTPHNQGTMTLGASTTINSLTVNDTNAVTLTPDGNSLAINAAGINGNTAGVGILVNSGAGALTIQAPVNLGGNQSWSNNSANLMTISGSIGGSGNLTLASNNSGILLSGTNVNNVGSISNSGTGAGTTTISGAIGTNVTSVTQNSTSSLLFLSGTNTYTGPTNVQAGTLRLGSTGTLNGTTQVTVSTGGAFGPEWFQPHGHPGHEYQRFRNRRHRRIDQQQWYGRDLPGCRDALGECQRRRVGQHYPLGRFGDRRGYLDQSRQRRADFERFQQPHRPGVGEHRHAAHGGQFGDGHISRDSVGDGRSRRRFERRQLHDGLDHEHQRPGEQHGGRSDQLQRHARDLRRRGDAWPARPASAARVTSL